MPHGDEEVGGEQGGVAQERGTPIQPAKDFTVTIRNTGLGGHIDNLRLDLKLMRTQVNTPLDPISVAHVVNGAAEPVTLTTVSNQRHGSIDGEGLLVAPGGERVETLRLTVPDGTAPGPIRIVFDLVSVENDTTAVLLSSASGRCRLDRREPVRDHHHRGPGREGAEAASRSRRPGHPGRP